MAVIYLDNAATTPLLPDVVTAMTNALTLDYGNPSSMHAFGRRTRSKIDLARTQVASFVGCDAADIIFTSGGTEADYSALFGAYLVQAALGRKHIVTTAIEHHAVLHTCEFLQQLGAEVTYVSPGSDGVVRVADMAAALRLDTGIVSMMAVNNETGAIQPVEEVARVVKLYHSMIVMHSDMVQVAGRTRIHLRQTLIDIASFTAHKIHGPKGAGALYIKKGTAWRPVMTGGSQERQRRGGTENTLGIIGFGVAAQRMSQDWGGHNAHLRACKDTLWSMLAPLETVFCLSPQSGAASILNMGFSGVSSELLLMRLDIEGVAAAAGSACTAGSLLPSHVLQAAGVPLQQVREAVRFSFGGLTTLVEVARAGQVIAKVVTEILDATE